MIRRQLAWSISMNFTGSVYSGVVDENVDLAEASDDFSHRALACGRIGDVANEAEMLRPQPF